MNSVKKAIKKIPFLATAYRKVRDNWLAGKEPVVTPFGFRFIGSTLMQSGNFEPEDVKIFQTLANLSDVVIDAGAHAGYYCLQALNLGKHLIAFEPMPLNIRMLLKNITLNGWEDRAEIFQLALGEKSGVAHMYGGGMGASLVKGWAGFSTKKPILVPVSSLDIVLGDRLAGQKTVILIDVEGAEYALLRGAKKMLAAEPKPVWMIEIALAGNQPEGRLMNPDFIPTFDLFWGRGYDVYVSIEGIIVMLDEQSVRKDAAAAIRDSSSNFIFIHKESDIAREALLNLNGS
jgi:FkbM family methyltransferase